MHIAVATSLATIIPTSISSARAHHKKGAIDWTLVRRWAPLIVIGALGGGLLARDLRTESLTLVFAGIAFIVALWISLRDEKKPLLSQIPSTPAGMILPFSIGGFSTLMGIGGGTLSVPILSACNYPMRSSVATASFFGLLISIPGMLSFVINGLAINNLPPFSLGYVNLLGFALIAPMTVLFAPLGARIAHSINPNTLRKLFAVFLLLTSAKMALSSIE